MGVGTRRAFIAVTRHTYDVRRTTYEWIVARTWLTTQTYTACRCRVDLSAVGELGLDYDRLHFCDKPTQRACFALQLEELVAATGLPMFLHSRNCAEDFRAALLRFGGVEVGGTGGGGGGGASGAAATAAAEAAAAAAAAAPKAAPYHGVVHSFTGTAKEAEELLDLGLYIGINGCSMKTEQNVAVVESLPLDRVMLETDAPWCSIKRTHASYAGVKTKFEEKKEKKFERGKCVKGRSEPCMMVQVRLGWGRKGRLWMSQRSETRARQRTAK